MIPFRDGCGNVKMTLQSFTPTIFHSTSVQYYNTIDALKLKNVPNLCIQYQNESHVEVKQNAELATSQNLL